jgi:alkanesulfonate monooxygenase SsuD/methylene tetrahydromethanopterin reductase-like flavin-dependent oxidoreductase (luciferase family)
MAEDEKRHTLIEGTPDEHADAIEKAYRRAYQQGANREWLFLALVLLGIAGYAVYAFVYPLLQRAP